MKMNLNRPVAQQIYRHFKGNLYQIHCIACHSETGEEMVVYQALYGDFRFYVRPLSMFMEKVDKVKYPNASQEYRFEPVNGADDKQKVQTLTPQTTPEPVTGTIPEMVSRVDSQPETNIIMQENSPADEEEVNLDEDVVRFLDADTYEQRIDILTGMQDRITDEMITIMATVIDIEVISGDVYTRYEDFKKSLMIRKHYEGVRLR